MVKTKLIYLIFNTFVLSTTAWIVPKVALKKKKMLLFKKGLCLPQPPPTPMSINTAGTAAVICGIGGTAVLLKQLNDNNSNNGQKPYTPEPYSLIGQTMVITGGTTGLGLESCQRLASAGANIILTARNTTKGENAVQNIKTYLNDNGYVYEEQNIIYKVLDFNNITSIKDAIVQNWTDITTIDVLMNNAGVMAIPQREITIDGYEKQIQTNHLGHFVLTSLLSSKFNDNVKIINVASQAHKVANSGLDFNYMWKAETGYDPWKSYGQSKLANIYFTRELQRRINKAGLKWSTPSVHPGTVATDLWRYNNAGGPLKDIIEQVLGTVLKTPEQGATTQIYLASVLDDDEEDIRGKYYINQKACVLDDYATNLSTGVRLWKDSEELTGIKFNI